MRVGITGASGFIGTRLVARLKAAGHAVVRIGRARSAGEPPDVVWEASAEPARAAGIRVVHPRTGIVLNPGGGALAKLLPFFSLGLGGKIGGGRQWMSWVALTDVVNAFEFLLADTTLAGAVNLT